MGQDKVFSTKILSRLAMVLSFRSLHSLLIESHTPLSAQISSGSILLAWRVKSVLDSNKQLWILYSSSFYQSVTYKYGWKKNRMIGQTAIVCASANMIVGKFLRASRSTLTWREYKDMPNERRLNVRCSIVAEEGLYEILSRTVWKRWLALQYSECKLRRTIQSK